MAKREIFAGGELVRFPHSRTTPGGHQPSRRLGVGAIATALRLPDRHLFGHYCRPCRGIWFGTALEVECPVCGNRSG